MAVIKCKMCDRSLTFSEGATVAKCEYCCGSKQTIPNQDSEKKLILFARADRLRRACEFDKAAVYEDIVGDFPEEAETFCGLVLCRYDFGTAVLKADIERNISAAKKEDEAHHRQGNVTRLKLLQERIGKAARLVAAGYS